MPTVGRMTETKVHLEDVTRAARQGLLLSLTASLLALAGMLIARIGGRHPRSASAGATTALIAWISRLCGRREPAGAMI